MVTGRLSLREYENKDGQKRFSLELEAVALGHDLARGTSEFNRGRGTSSPTFEGSDDHSTDGERASLRLVPDLEQEAEPRLAVAR